MRSHNHPPSIAEGRGESQPSSTPLTLYFHPLPLLLPPVHSCLFCSILGHFAFLRLGKWISTGRGSSESVSAISMDLSSTRGGSARSGSRKEFIVFHKRERIRAKCPKRKSKFSPPRISFSLREPHFCSVDLEPFRDFSPLFPSPFPPLFNYHVCIQTFLGKSSLTGFFKALWDFIYGEGAFDAI